MGESQNSPSVGGSKVELYPEQITLSETGPWKRRTKREKCLLVLVVILFIVAVAFIAAFLHFYLDRQDMSDKDSGVQKATGVCTTNDCLQTAAYISNNLNTLVDPCDDFYDFVCGGWQAHNPIPPSKFRYNILDVRYKDVNGILRDLLFENDPNAIDAVKKARTFYKSCEDTEAMDAKGITPLTNLLKTGGSNLFPTLQADWQDEGLSLNQVVERVGAVGGLGASRLVTWYVGTDPYDSNTKKIYITETGYFLMSRQQYLVERNSSPLTLYEQQYVDIMTSLGADPTVAAQDAKDVVDFEIRVVNSTQLPSERVKYAKIYKQMTLRNISNRYPKFDWLGYFKRQIPEEYATITMDEGVIMAAEVYYDNLFQFLDSTPRRTLMNYCMWRLIYPMIDTLNKKLRDTKEDFKMKLSGITRRKDRWTVCVTATTKHFPDVVGRLFVDKKFSPDAKHKVEDLIKDLMAAFKDMIRESDWMTETTRKAALEKADAMKYHIGYGDYMKNDTHLNEKTKTYKLSEDTYFDNHNSVHRASHSRAVRSLRQPVDRDQFRFSPAVVNAYQNWNTNAIGILAAILEKPFFSTEFMNALNYGAIGVIIGHEITHGFDTQGSVYDKYGNLHNWWQPEDLKRFKERYECMVQQYSNYTVPEVGMNVNGKLTIGENIADNGGLKEAFRAYRRFIDKRGSEELLLPQLDFTPDQLFFIGTASVHCENTRPQRIKYLLQSGYHTLSKYRVIGIMQNSRQFSRAFNCPAGSYMNPEKKCDVW